MNEILSIPLYAKARDTITGVTGIIVCRQEWSNGCLRAGIQQPQKPDGTLPDVMMFDWQEIEIIETYNIEKFQPKRKIVKKGGPQRPTINIR